jgi:Tol biopolymer transport system component
VTKWRNGKGAQHLAVYDRAGSAYRVTSHGRGRPQWDPKNRFLAYTCSLDRGSPRLCLFDTQSRKERVLDLPGLASIADPAFSPDGRRVAVTAITGSQLTYSIVVVDVATSKFVAVVRDHRSLSSPQWSPDGGYLAFLTAGGVIVRHLATGQEVKVLAGDFDSLQWASDSIQDFGVF